ncbi:2-succinyl-5-enolpyruvyl-6-hydroxy-3-cyclohexene-1-carboxylic-acid synthase [Vibrio salinus]|uniref:2-succinyl-5-enolpyruvyl-6-hydroxy-3- cyclohexene-1-carboxylic-acid synthase n=1 Tax=Vibrio salinus TaxID=2899784 RepID=UPI001E31664A|nr:2-succinyl-5-enolpyruvyl-6-hydroxy-3-cyclohexene-1-carboxylic-acid synthase [Vibrio salinus]MCE0494671.1 2-succinyl-5-enolpyruvyl-6-hydroxy-3-cyclohexene-1-carboxylic-acid synthase [Vibrio salinus]
MEHRPIINRLWSQVLLDELSRLGVEHVCVAPGSRSTPLIVEANDNKKLTLHSHFDERGLGFLALGMAKASQKPVAVIVTSGTAVANLLPAIAESHLTGEKLVVLTADRPVELIDCGANQAINQIGIFSHHVTQAVNLPSPTADIPLSWLLTTIDDAMFRQSQLGGAVHINCPYPEPLYADAISWDDACYGPELKQWLNSQQPYNLKLSGSDVHEFAGLSDAMTKKGVIIIGSVSLAQAEKAKSLAEGLGWPVLCDPQSGISSDWAYYDIWMQNTRLKEKLSQCEVIIQFGGRLVSKRLNAWLSSQLKLSDCRYWYVSPCWSRNNQSHLVQTHIVTNIETWIDRQQKVLKTKRCLHSGWADDLAHELHPLPALISAVADEQTSVCELSLVSDIARLGNQCDVFIGNSLIVRLFDMFARFDSRETYSNRGASGIDGLVATAAGVQTITNRPMILFMGDTSLLYDLNSMALLSKVVCPFVLVVTNNDGGAIFDLLPVPKEQKQRLYQMPHGFGFEHASRQFGLDYHCPGTLDQFQNVVNNHILNGVGALVVEVNVPNEQAATHIRTIVEQVNAI